MTVMVVGRWSKQRRNNPHGGSGGKGENGGTKSGRKTGENKP